jgi:hypothetical protein
MMIVSVKSTFYSTREMSRCVDPVQDPALHLVVMSSYSLNLEVSQFVFYNADIFGEYKLIVL